MIDEQMNRRNIQLKMQFIFKNKMVKMILGQECPPYFYERYTEKNYNRIFIDL